MKYRVTVASQETKGVPVVRRTHTVSADSKTAARGIVDRVYRDKWQPYKRGGKFRIEKVETAKTREGRE